MRNILLLFLLSSFFVCAQTVLPNQKGTKIKTTKGTEMPSKEKKFLVEIMITRTFYKDGGQAPSPEQVKEWATPKPLVSKKLYIKKGTKNTFGSKILLEISSDSLGKIQLQLPSGNYFIVDETKKDTSYYNTLVKENERVMPDWEIRQRRIEENPGERRARIKVCLKNWYQQPNLVFEVKEADIKNLSLNFSSSDHPQPPCFPHIPVP